MAISEEEALATLMSSGVHGQFWPGSVYAVALYTTRGYSRYFMAKNRTLHAEDMVIAHFEHLLERGNLDPQKIYLFISVSPCFRCSQRIINFLDAARWQHRVDLEVEVVFSTLYLIRRPSCVRNPACLRHLPSYDDHSAQVDGLKKLCNTPGVVLRALEGQDWHVLQNTLGVRARFVRGRWEEDNLLRDDLHQLMFTPLFPTSVYPSGLPLSERRGHLPLARHMEHNPYSPWQPAYGPHHWPPSYNSPSVSGEMPWLHRYHPS